jgi:hypothetical protein
MRNFGAEVEPLTARGIRPRHERLIPERNSVLPEQAFQSGVSGSVYGLP